MSVRPAGALERRRARRACAVLGWPATHVGDGVVDGEQVLPDWATRRPAGRRPRRRSATAANAATPACPAGSARRPARPPRRPSRRRSAGQRLAHGEARSGSLPVASSQRPTQPVTHLAVGHRGLPDVHRPEVAAVRVRVADAPDDGQVPRRPTAPSAREVRVQAEPVAQGEHLRPAGSRGAPRPPR